MLHRAALRDPPPVPAEATISPTARRGFLLLVVVALAHRTAVFMRYFPDLRRLIAKNPDYLTWQFPPLPALSHHLAASLFFLQQTPPIPALILGGLVKAAAWPFTVTYLLIGLQSVLSIATAMLMFRIQLFFTRRLLLALVAPIVFLLSSDLLLMEYNWQGQSFYENLGMCFVLIAAYCMLQVERTGCVRYSGGLGLVTGLLALSRATFSYFFVVPLFFLVVLRPPRFSRHVFLFLLCGLSLQLAWCLKNGFLYDRFSLDTSSWKGSNFAVGLLKAGAGDQFLKSILEAPDAFPGWFVAMNREHGLLPWVPAHAPYLPQSATARDRRAQQCLDGAGAPADSYSQSLVSELYMRAYLRFARRYPDVVWQKFLASYALFWQPIRNFAWQFLDLFWVRPVVEDPFAAGEVFALIRDGQIPEPQYLMTEQYVFLGPKPRQPPEAHTFTLTLLPTLFWMRNVAAFHLLAPALLLVGVARRVYTGRLCLPVGYPFMLCVIAYVAVLSSLAEHGENMRFRLSVEPLIWVSSAFGVHIAWDIVRGRAGRD
jgi:hypothetical protein